MTRTLMTCCAALLLLPAVALADTRIDERHNLAAGGRIELSNVAGKVTVRGWDRNDVQLTGTLSDGLQLRQERVPTASAGRSSIRVAATTAAQRWC